MKFPKNKDTVYAVVRSHVEDGADEVLIAILRTPEAADNFAGACQQEMLDKHISKFQFGVQAVVYYDE